MPENQNLNPRELEARVLAARLAHTEERVQQLGRDGTAAQRNVDVVVAEARALAERGPSVPNSRESDPKALDVAARLVAGVERINQIQREAAVAVQDFQTARHAALRFAARGPVVNRGVENVRER